MFKLKQAFVDFIKSTILKLRLLFCGKYSEGLLFKTENGNLLCPISDLTVGRKLGFKGQYDLEEIEEIYKIIDQDDVLVICGCHIGSLFIPFSKKCKEIIGFEASPIISKFLKINLHINNVTNYQLFNQAVGDRADHIDFYTGKLNSGGSKIKPLKNEKMYNINSNDTIISKVEMIKLKDRINELNIQRIDLMIMDIEGAEYLAIKGLEDKFSLVSKLYMEFVPHHIKNVSNVSLDEFIKPILANYKKSQILYPLKKEFVNDSVEFNSFINNSFLKGESQNILFYN